MTDKLHQPMTDKEAQAKTDKLHQPMTSDKEEQAKSVRGLERRAVTATAGWRAFWGGLKLQGWV